MFLMYSLASVTKTKSDNLRSYIKYAELVTKSQKKQQINKPKPKIIFDEAEFKSEMPQQQHQNNNSFDKQYKANETEKFGICS